MPAFSFTVFKEEVKSGVKRQTIRKMGKRLRKRPIKVGDKLYLYWHMRQKDCEKLLEATCTFTRVIQIQNQYWLGKNRLTLYEPPIDEDNLWTPVSDLVTGDIARRDGFRDTDEMLAWFTKHHALPDVFQVIRW